LPSIAGVALIVIAKDPQPGRCKTRLCPPCTPAQAAELAEAALRDTLKVVRETPAARYVLVLDGAPTRWRGEGFELIPQRGAGLDERLQNAFADVAAPALLVGMDTPQLTRELLLDGVAALSTGAADAVLGPALDGGYWSVGLRGPSAGAFMGVPMSRSDTLAHQRARLAGLGFAIHEQPALRDIDTIEDAHAVAASAPSSRFATALATLGGA
jgi:rSAM/selenodomain-associated transferase 1